MPVQTALIETHSACQKSAICRTDGATCGIVPITPNGIYAHLREWENIYAQNKKIAPTTLKQRVQVLQNVKNRIFPTAKANICL